MPNWNDSASVIAYVQEQKRKKEEADRAAEKAEQLARRKDIDAKNAADRARAAEQKAANHKAAQSNTTKYGPPTRDEQPTRFSGWRDVRTPEQKADDDARNKQEKNERNAAARRAATTEKVSNRDDVPTSRNWNVDRRANAASQSRVDETPRYSGTEMAEAEAARRQNKDIEDSRKESASRPRQETAGDQFVRDATDFIHGPDNTQPDSNRYDTPQRDPTTPWVRTGEDPIAARLNTGVTEAYRQGEVDQTAYDAEKKQQDALAAVDAYRAAERLSQSAPYKEPENQGIPASIAPELVKAPSYAPAHASEWDAIKPTPTNPYDPSNAPKEDKAGDAWLDMQHKQMQADNAANWASYAESKPDTTGMSTPGKVITSILRGGQWLGVQAKAGASGLMYGFEKTFQPAYNAYTTPLSGTSDYLAWQKQYTEPEKDTSPEGAAKLAEHSRNVPNIFGGTRGPDDLSAMQLFAPVLGALNKTFNPFNPNKIKQEGTQYAVDETTLASRGQTIVRDQNGDEHIFNNNTWEAATYMTATPIAATFQNLLQKWQTAGEYIEKTIPAEHASMQMLNEWVDHLPPDVQDTLRAGQVNQVGNAHSQWQTMIDLEQKANIDDLKLEVTNLYNAGRTDAADYLNKRVNELEGQTYTETILGHQEPMAMVVAQFALDPLNLVDVVTGAVAIANTAQTVARLANAVDQADAVGDIARASHDAGMLTRGGKQIGAVAATKRANGILNAFAKTPASVAAEHRAVTMGWFAGLLSQVQNTEDARRIVDVAINTPHILLEEGIEGLTSPFFVKMAQDGLKPTWGASAIANESITKRFAIIKNAGADILAGPSLAPGATWNPVNVIADLDNALFKAASQAEGIALKVDIPYGASDFKVVVGQNAADVVFVNKKGAAITSKTFKTGAEAQEYADALRTSINAGKGDVLDKLMKAGRIPDTAARAVMSDLWLNLRPGHWVRNAANAMTTLTTDGLMTFMKMQDIDAGIVYKSLAGGMNPRIFEAVNDAGNTVGAAVEAFGDTPNWSRRILAKNNPFAAASEAGSRIWSGPTDIGGRLPVGEQAYVKRGWYKQFSGSFNKAWDDAVRTAALPVPADSASALKGKPTATFAQFLADEGIPKDIADKLVKAVTRTGQQQGKEQVYDAVKAILNAPTIAPHINDLDIPDELVSNQGIHRIQTAIDTWFNGKDMRTEAGINRLKDDLNSIFDYESKTIGDIANSAPPQPGVYVWQNQEALQETGALMDDMTDAAKKAGIDPAKAKAEAQKAGAEYHQAETAAQDALVEAVKAQSPEKGVTYATDAWNRIYQARVETRKQIDALAQQAASSKQWDNYYTKRPELNKKLADKITSIVDETKKAMQEGKPPKTSTAQDLINRVAKYDAEVARRAELPPTGSAVKMQADFQQHLEANRTIIDALEASMYRSAQQYPSTEAIDVMFAATQRAQLMGAQVAAYITPFRNDALAGLMPIEDYYKLRNQAWNEYYKAVQSNTIASTRAIVEIHLAKNANSAEDALNVVADARDIVDELTVQVRQSIAKQGDKYERAASGTGRAGVDAPNAGGASLSRPNGVNRAEQSTTVAGVHRSTNAEWAAERPRLNEAITSRATAGAWPEDFTAAIHDNIAQLPDSARQWLEDNNRDWDIKYVSDTDAQPQWLKPLFERAAGFVIKEIGRAPTIYYGPKQRTAPDVFNHELLHVAWSSLWNNAAPDAASKKLINSIAQTSLEDGRHILAQARAISQEPSATFDTRAAAQQIEWSIETLKQIPAAEQAEAATFALEDALRHALDDFDFLDDIGVPANQASIINYWQAIAEEAGVKLNRSYDLEETVAYHLQYNPEIADALFAGTDTTRSQLSPGGPKAWDKANSVNPSISPGYKPKAMTDEQLANLNIDKRQVGDTFEYEDTNAPNTSYRLEPTDNGWKLVKETYDKDGSTVNRIVTENLGEYTDLPTAERDLIFDAESGNPLPTEASNTVEIVDLKATRNTLESMNAPTTPTHYHQTTPEKAAQIRTNGFRTDAPTTSEYEEWQEYGPGIYLANDKESAAAWGKQLANPENNTATIAVDTANANIYQYDLEIGGQNFREKQRRIIEQLYGVSEQEARNLITQATPPFTSPGHTGTEVWRNYIAEDINSSKGFQKLLKDKGYDGISINEAYLAKYTDSGTKYNQTVIFDPAKIQVVADALPPTKAITTPTPVTTNNIFEAAQKAGIATQYTTKKGTSVPVDKHLMNLAKQLGADIGGKRTVSQLTQTEKQTLYDELLRRAAAGATPLSEAPISNAAKSENFTKTIDAEQQTLDELLDLQRGNAADGIADPKLDKKVKKQQAKVASLNKSADQLVKGHTIPEPRNVPQHIQDLDAKLQSAERRLKNLKARASGSDNPPPCLQNDISRTQEAIDILKRQLKRAGDPNQFTVEPTPERMAIFNAKKAAEQQAYNDLRKAELDYQTELNQWRVADGTDMQVLLDQDPALKEAWDEVQFYDKKWHDLSREIDEFDFDEPIEPPKVLTQNDLLGLEPDENTEEAIADTIRATQGQPKAFEIGETAQSGNMALENKRAELQRTADELLVDPDTGELVSTSATPPAAAAGSGAGAPPPRPPSQPPNQFPDDPFDNIPMQPNRPVYTVPDGPDEAAPGRRPTFKNTNGAAPTTPGRETLGPLPMPEATERYTQTPDGTWIDNTTGELLPGRPPNDPTLNPYTPSSDRVLTPEQQAQLAAAPAQAQESIRNILAGIKNTTTPYQQRQIMNYVAKMLNQFDNIVYASGVVADHAVDFAMLNYKNRRNIDNTLATMIPYHYFWTRSALNWARRVVEKPAAISHYMDVQNAIKTENQQSGVPNRMRGTIPLYTREDGTQIRIANITDFMFPFQNYKGNDFNNPDDDASSTEKLWLASQKYSPGFFPYIQYAAAFALDATDPLPNGDKRTDAFYLGGVVPQLRLAETAYNAVTGQNSAIAGTTQDPFVPYVERRNAALDSVPMNNVPGTDPKVAQLAQQISVNLENGQARYTHIPPEQQAAADAAYAEAVKRTAQEKLLAQASMVTGAGMYALRPEERVAKQIQSDYYGAAVSAGNPYGSDAAQASILAQNPSLAPFTTKTGDPGADMGQPAIQMQRTEQIQYRDQIIKQSQAEVQQAIKDAIAANPAIGVAEMATISAAVKGKYQPQIDAATANIEALNRQAQEDRFNFKGEGMPTPMTIRPSMPNPLDPNVATGQTGVSVPTVNMHDPTATAPGGPAPTAPIKPGSPPTVQIGDPRALGNPAALGALPAAPTGATPKPTPTTATYPAAAAPVAPTTPIAPAAPVPSLIEAAAAAGIPQPNYRGMSEEEKQVAYNEWVFKVSNHLTGKPTVTEKPVKPAPDAPEAEWDKYNAAYDKYNAAYDAYNTSAEAFVVANLTNPTSIVGLNPYTEQEALDYWQQYKQQNMSPEEIQRRQELEVINTQRDELQAFYDKEDIAGAKAYLQTHPELAAQLRGEKAANGEQLWIDKPPGAGAADIAGVTAKYGAPAGAMVEEYLALPPGAARQEYAAAHPEIKAYNLYAFNPKAAAEAEALFGEGIVEKWAKTPPGSDDPAAMEARKQYLADNPDVWLADAWLTGRPEPYDPAAPKEDKAVPGADWAKAEELFGKDIWDKVFAYKTGDRSQGVKDSYYAFSAWWNEAYPDDGKQWAADTGGTQDARVAAGDWYKLGEFTPGEMPYDPGAGRYPPNAYYISSDGLVAYDRFGRRIDSAGNTGPTSHGYAGGGAGYSSGGGGYSSGGYSSGGGYGEVVAPQQKTPTIRTWRGDNPWYSGSWLNAGKGLKPT